MKSIFKSIIGFILAWRASRFLRKHRIKVIAVTGSVGKTSTKEAIYTVLKPKFDVLRSQKSFNTPIGMCLAILGEEESGFTSATAWLGILKRVFFKKRHIPEMMVLEMGADAPGDIAQLVRIAPPFVSVVTAVKPVHLGQGQFSSLDDIAREKGTLVRCLSVSHLAVLNGDDERVRVMETSATKLLYGQGEQAELKATELEATAGGISFHLSYGGHTQYFKVPVVGAFQIYVCLPAIAVGLWLGIGLGECARSLSAFKLPPGRMNPIEGRHGSHILDGSYNASPSTVEVALDMLDDLRATRKIVALGSMNELGELSERAHFEAGKKAAMVSDVLIFVGPQADLLAKGAKASGFSQDELHIFSDSHEAGVFLSKHLQSGDLVLVKGSQNQVRMEHLVKAIMAHPERASELLCRQGMGWTN